MRFVYVVALLLLATCAAIGYDAPLASVRDLECATKNAVRFTQGATTRGKAGGPTAFIKSVARGSYPIETRPDTCDVRVTLHVRDSKQEELEMPLGHNADGDFDIVDWSSKGDLILISSEHWLDPVAASLVVVYNVKDKTHRSIDVAGLFASEGWIRCAARIEPSGFAPDGRVVVSAGPGSRVNRPKDCSPDKSYWAFDPKNPKVQRLQSRLPAAAIWSGRFSRVPAL